MTLSSVLPQLVALGQVVIINVVLSGDNAIVVGLAAAGLPSDQRAKVILAGITVATVLRVLFALVATQLLNIIGLRVAGGLLLLWVCWNFWRELTHQRRERLKAAAVANRQLTSEERRELSEPEEALPGAAPGKTMRQAIAQIVIADVSMSLDNVLAIAGAASQSMTIMVIGLVLSIAMMAVAANFIANLLQRFHWIAYIGLAIILWVALEMIYRGSVEVVTQVGFADMTSGWQ
jgi:YjbE family integral membrane protein